VKKPEIVRASRIVFLCAALLLVSAVCTLAQTTGSYERTFSQSKAAVQKALQQIHSSLAGRLPVLEGFASAEENLDHHDLDHYDRGFYQARVEVVATPSGATRVRLNTKVTAFYTDTNVPSRSGYKLLTSNGRIESDLLDQLSEKLASGGNSKSSLSEEAVASSPKTTSPVKPEPTIAAPNTPDRGAFSSSRSQSLSAQEHGFSHMAAPAKAPDPAMANLQAEADSLQEVLKNQAHPKNLVAVKKSGTPVVASASLSAKTLFMASLHDEFEMLDFNSDWVHVRISGLSRGWIWRDSLEMPEGIPDTAAHPAKERPAAADVYQATRDEVAPFPGDWEPLRGKTVKIITMQKVDENAKDSGAQARMEFAKYEFDLNFADVNLKAKELAGIVLMFDSADGGMVAVTLPVLQQWKAGTLSDAALWHKCFFDPPEVFNPSAAAATQ